MLPPVDRPVSASNDAANYPIEILIGIAIISVAAGAFTGDVVVGLGTLFLTAIAYLLYRILRTLELIAAKL